METEIMPKIAKLKNENVLQHDMFEVNINFSKYM